jgi:hypothetical protein
MDTSKGAQMFIDYFQPIEVNYQKVSR